jgi:hypothetical protein
MSRATPVREDPRKTTGWAIHDFTLSVATLNAMARHNPHVAFPASGDARRRPLGILSDTERQQLLNAKTKVGTK